MNRTGNRRKGRPPAFSYQQIRKGLLWRRSAESILHCDEVSVSRLAERFGTPLYVYSASAIRDHVRAFERAFRKVPHTVCYSVKANSNLGILRLLAGLDCGFDVVSGGELERVLRVDRRAAKKVVFSGVGKTADEMLAALKARILLFNVESEAELWALAECAARSRERARVALRINPNVPSNTHPYISTGLEQHKFGIPIVEARTLYARASGTRYFRIAGVSVHIGSQITDVKPFAAAMERVAELVRELRGDGHQIDFVDAGGGLGIAYEEPDLPEFATYVGEYADALLQPLRGLKVHLLLEPGRSVVGPAGALLTRVLYRKTNGAKKFVVVDAAMNDLLRPSLYEAYHEIIPARLGKDDARETVDVVGPVCETGDFFARARELPVTSEGDLLALLDAGAYGMVLASNYNTRPRPAEVLIDGKSVKVIRRRETIEDLLRSESQAH
ncbi:MAG TPA: diaminopimelate decarboxylase [Terriglobales bacterium]|nr:diaminopimelate decarboxylase [Terriglobales bacterium]